MLRSLPPAGNPILLDRAEHPEQIFHECFEDRSLFLYGSGTMALAASLMAAKYAASDRYDTSCPEVLLPAYACPDLVSAVVYAGLKPVLVDMEADTPWMDLDKLRSLLGPNTVAVIAAHFLGIPERLEAIRIILEGSSAFLIEDSAQLVPVKRSVEPDNSTWQGDIVILSFGRGKPVSLLGGGAVLCRDQAITEHFPLVARAQFQDGSAAPDESPGKGFRLKVRLYNALLSPRIYGLLRFVPFLHLGKTIFEPLTTIIPFGQNRIRLLAANIDSYRMKTRKQQEWLANMLEDIDCDLFQDLSALAGDRTALPLLRYPILLKDQWLRDKLQESLSRKGLGCSGMYPKPMPEIAGLEVYFEGQNNCPQAKLFSQRLLTLPCHSGVTEADVRQIQQVVTKVFESTK